MQFLCTVAGNKAASDRAQLRHFAAAALCDAGAARVKTAAGRRDSLLSRRSAFQRHVLLVRNGFPRRGHYANILHGKGLRFFRDMTE